MIGSYNKKIQRLRRGNNRGQCLTMINDFNLVFRHFTVAWIKILSFRLECFKKLLSDDGRSFTQNRSNPTTFPTNMSTVGQLFYDQSVDYLSYHDLGTLGGKLIIP